MAAEPFRLANGGRIDRARPLRFRFDGCDYTGLEGDTLASALLANGVRITARSFKYHRPRGIMGSGVEEPATLVELMGADASGNRPATTVRLTEGLVARSVNAWPSARFDLGAMNQLFGRFIPAGFYYKTFKWPDWHLYEPSIRKAAGLAAAPSQPPEGAFEARHAHADLVIAGAGPAGLMAALVAGRAGARVLIADEGSEAGGSLLSRRMTLDGTPAMDWVTAVVAELATMPNVTHLQNATVWAYREHNLMMVHERAPQNPSLIGRNWRVRAGQVITATGAIERTMVFAGNDRPGVMLASAAQAYVNRWAVRPGVAGRGLHQQRQRLCCRGGYGAGRHRRGRHRRQPRGRAQSRAGAGRKYPDPRRAGRDGCARPSRGARRLGCSHPGRRVPAHRLRSGRHVGRLEPGCASLFAIARQDRLGRGAANLCAR